MLLMLDPRAPAPPATGTNVGPVGDDFGARTCGPSSKRRPPPSGGGVTWQISIVPGVRSSTLESSGISVSRRVGWSSAELLKSRRRANDTSCVTAFPSEFASTHLGGEL